MAADTFPKLLEERARHGGGRPALREKEFGIWRTLTWADARREIHELACGFAAAGVRRGERVAVIGDNRPELYLSLCAAQCLGAVPVPLYQDAVAAETQFVLDHSGARLVVAEDQEQVDKILEARERCPEVKKIVYSDGRGMRHYDDEILQSYESLLDAGRAHARAQPDFVEREIAQGRGGDAAVLLYTSGTTGEPKGVVLSHENVLVTCRNLVKFDRLSEREEVLAYLPMAWVGDHIFSYGQAYCAGFCVSCPESAATVMHDMREIGPTYFFAPPRIFESLLTTVMIRMEDAGAVKKKMFGFFLGVARRVGADILNRKPVAAGQRFLYALGRWLVYEPLKDAMGFGRVRLAYTAGEAIGPEIFDFYRSLGMNIKQLYGQTEGAVFVTAQPDGEVYPDSVGKPSPQVELRFGDNGEVLYRSPGVFQSYYKNPEATAKTRTEDGWVRTGDAGFLDERGHLHIVDRAADVGKLNDGTLFAPKFIENKLKFFPHIKEAVVFGDRRDFCAALVNIDLEAVGNWAERNNIPYASYQELAARPEVYAMIADSVQTVNRGLAADKQLCNSQIRRFVVLHKELDADDGELTRTRKVRRRHIVEKYAVLVDALYGGESHCFVEVAVTFEDGRVGAVSGDLQIMDAEPCAPQPLAEAA